MPRPQILKTMTVTRAMMATGQLVAQLLMADGARIRPMAMMMGPVTTGGKKRRDASFRQKMEQKCSKLCEQQCGGNGKSGQDCTSQRFLDKRK